MATKRVLMEKDGEEIEVMLPAEWEICDSCRGSGGSSAHLGAITSDEWHQEWDEDMRADYMAGRYDRPCGECNGTGKVLTIDHKRCTSADHKAAIAWLQDEAEADAEERAMLRMEARLMGDYE